MKQKNINQKFEPFELKLQVNTLDELISIYELFNKSSGVILESYENPKTKYPFKYSKALNFSPYWKQLDKILKKIYKED